MATTAASPTDRPHRGRQALHLRLGRRDAPRATATMKRPPRRQGRRPRGDDARRAAHAAGFTITTEACNDYFANGKELPSGLWDDVLSAVKEVEARSGKGFGDAANPLSSRSARGPVLDARDDGHGPQPRPQRGDPRRASSS